MAKQHNAMLAQLGNNELPLDHRAQQMIDIMAGAKEEKENYMASAEAIFERLADGAGNEKVKKMEAMLKAILTQLESAPLRLATFIQTTGISAAAAHAMVVMDNGELACIVAHDQEGVGKLKLGDRVMVDAQMKILVHPAIENTYFGPESRLERKVDDRHVEVITHQDEKCVVMVGPSLMKQIESGITEPGSSIVLGAGGKLGVYAIPAEHKLSFRYLDHGSVPDVRVDRDIGSPPRIIEQVAKHIREEMTRPELRRKFRLRPCITRLLCGVSGSGKSLSIAAIHRRVYEVMEEVTKTPIAKLPPRVFRFRTSQMLSMWLGESDKNIDRLFDEVERMTDEKFTTEKGKEFTLPVMVVLEEAEGMGRHRGDSNDSVYDRILTTLLQRLDPNREGLANRLVVFLSTTNEPHLIDPAYLRRIGGSVETFGRLDQKSFVAILGKHVDGLPAANGDGTPQKKIWQSIINGLSKWMFTPGVDPGVVELGCQGQSEPMIKYRRDFLTGALIDRAVQEAASKAWEQSIAGDAEAGIGFDQLVGSFNDQVLSVAHQLTPQNVGSYLDMPDGVRVHTVRRIQQKEHDNTELSHAARKG